MKTRRILLVDDDPDDRALAALVLSRDRGVAVEEAADGVAFALALARGGFDLVVVERRLQWGDGLRVVEAVKERFPDLPVVMLTRDLEPALVAEAVAAGLDALLPKGSAGFLELAATAERLLGRRGPERRAPAPAGPSERPAAELRDFAHVVSHDLQAPLGRIDRYARLLAESLGDGVGAAARGHLEQLQRSAEQMQAMLDAILEYARVESRGGSFEEVDLEAVLEEVREVLAAELEGSGALLDHEPLPTVEADRAQMVRLFQNLIANAVKFRGKEPPSIRVAARRNGAGWDLSVIDDGIGIPAADRERVFGMFERLHTDSEIPGSGVGLAICKRIAERHGGSIRVEPQTGRGSAFIVHLPHRS